MPAPLYLSGPCEICSQPAHGRHFGVMSCRACAAFFRRAATSRTLRAQDKVCTTGKCTIFEDGKYRCKSCRLQKCLAVGMDVNKFQSDRDLLSNTSNYTKRSRVSPPQSLANFLGRPEFILCCEPEKVSHVKTIVDVSDLVYKAMQILQEDIHLIPFKFDNSLEKLTFAMDDMKLKRGNQKFEIVKTLGKAESLMFFETNFLNAAQWFTGFPEFTELDMSVKIEILKSTWLVWLRLEKLAETAAFQRRKILGSDLFMCSEGACMNIEEVEMDLSWCSNYSSEQLRTFMMCDFEQYWRDSVETLIELEPTNIELNFMLIQLCLNEAGKKFQGKILEATDKLLQIQADNLHDYYTKKLKMSNYSSRLSRLMKVNKAIEADVRERKERSYIARVFNLFSIEYSHPEMFETA
ncbi:hypothetical protein GCK72_019998 [Caenorhabditis remanei]|uniref:Uncharacterized protein n=1 Tax=Caenorhabditis remanei TaxID=31234 RepID=A0A6A5GFU2_CAERE|nr:hypothetical protein GCK72_019998 [Caenorhabditis remanei]KAF1753441.1 hypothetical protein GCK72_019998 [Caenorhabditis remanei]